MIGPEIVKGRGALRLFAMVIDVETAVWNGGIINTRSPMEMHMPSHH
jgi:hypothetical protein